MKSHSKLASLVERIAALNNQQAEIGYFEDSGQHTLAKMSYAALAYLHEFPIKGKHPIRPVLGQIAPMQGEASNRVFFKSLLQDYVRIGSKYKVEDVLTSVGRKWTQKGKYIFGNSSMLIVTKNPTPLYDTGELSDNFGFKTSLNYKIRYS